MCFIFPLPVSILSITGIISSLLWLNKISKSLSLSPYAHAHTHTRMHALMCTCTHAHSEAILVAAARSHQYTTLTEHGSWVLRTNALVPGFPTRLPYASELAAATPTDPGLLPSLPISKALDSSAPSGRAGCPTACLGLQN